MTNSAEKDQNYIKVEIHNGKRYNI
jgi:hypothetical protein